MRVPEIVEANAWDGGRPDMPPERVSGEPIRVNGVALDAGEHKTVAGRGTQAERHPLFELGDAVRPHVIVLGGAAWYARSRCPLAACYTPTTTAGCGSYALREENDKMSEAPKDADTTKVLRRIDRTRSGLAKLLRSQDAKALAKRPPSGDWSIIENVRHLLFAEQLHLGKFLPDGFEWSRVGLSGRTGRAYAEVGKDATDDLEEVLQEWNAVHRPIRKAVKGGDAEVQNVLAGNLRHLVHHIDIIKTLLSDSGG